MDEDMGEGCPVSSFFLPKTGIIPESIFNLYTRITNSNGIFMSNAIIMKANIIRERAVIMGKFDYKFVEVPCDGNLKNGNTETLERCKEIIMNEAAQGWRLIQIISPAGERRMISGGCYEIVLEKEN